MGMQLHFIEASFRSVRRNSDMTLLHGVVLRYEWESLTLKNKFKIPQANPKFCSKGVLLLLSLEFHPLYPHRFQLPIMASFLRNPPTFILPAEKVYRADIAFKST
jgi:hypothetical protein